MRTKFESLLGFAARARKVVSGTGTCSITIKKGKAKLLILSEDAAENTVKKLTGEAKSKGIPYRIYGQSDNLSHIIGSSGRTTLVVTDEHFAECMMKEIDEN